MAAAAVRTWQHIVYYQQPVAPQLWRHVTTHSIRSEWKAGRLLSKLVIEVGGTFVVKESFVVFFLVENLNHLKKKNKYTTKSSSTILEAFCIFMQEFFKCKCNSRRRRTSIQSQLQQFSRLSVSLCKNFPNENAILGHKWERVEFNGIPNSKLCLQLGKLNTPQRLFGCVIID